MKLRNILAMLLTLALALSLIACGAAETPAPNTENTQASTPSEEATDAADATDATELENPIQVMVLNGTTGFGMANLMDEAANGTSAQPYEFSVETDASNIVAALANGSTDIAALPTNAAAAVYNKTQGQVQVLALNTRGVLYVVTDGSVTVETMADLEGKTVYAPAQNPTFIFQQLCQANNVNVTVDNTYAQPADLNTAVASGQVSIAVLPEPMVTVAKANNPDLVVALDLTKEWDAVNPEGSLIQGCVVVRKEFAQQYPGAVATFLTEYEASITAMQEDVEGTSQKIQTHGIFAKAPVAAKAIPNCNTCFIAGEEMKTALAEFLKIMHQVAPASVGGTIPGDDFYYIVK